MFRGVGNTASDDFIARTIRQQHQLYLLTWAPVFLDHALLAIGDCCLAVKPIALGLMVRDGVQLIARRQSREALTGTTAPEVAVRLPDVLMRRIAEVTAD